MSEPQIIIWECSDIEMGWILSMVAEQEREHEQALIDGDIELSRALAMEALDGGDMPVPWYADDWTAVQEPEIVEGWIL